MTPEPMSNEIIVHTLKDIQQNVVEIKIQTQKTNGRVNSLENSRAYIAGAMAVVVMLLVPIFLAMVYSFFK